jgi:hypothetical protein
VQCVSAGDRTWIQVRLLSRDKFPVVFFEHHSVGDEVVRGMRGLEVLGDPGHCSESNERGFIDCFCLNINLNRIDQKRGKSASLYTLVDCT